MFLFFVCFDLQSTRLTFRIRYLWCYLKLGHIFGRKDHQKTSSFDGPITYKIKRKQILKIRSSVLLKSIALKSCTFLDALDGHQLTDSWTRNPSDITLGFFSLSLWHRSFSCGFNWHNTQWASASICLSASLHGLPRKTMEQCLASSYPDGKRTRCFIANYWPVNIFLKWAGRIGE